MQYTNSSSRNGHQEKEAAGMSISKGENPNVRNMGERESMQASGCEYRQQSLAVQIIKLMHKSVPEPPQYMGDALQ